MFRKRSHGSYAMLPLHCNKTSQHCLKRFFSQAYCTFLTAKMDCQNLLGKRTHEDGGEIENNTHFRKTLRLSEKRDKLRQEFSAANINLMNEKRSIMDAQELVWALFSFNNVQNIEGCNGGVYEILEDNVVVYISGIPPDVHVRDALNAHFSGNDKLALGSYLSQLHYRQWRNFQARFMLSETPREDARILLRHFQLKNKGKVPRFN